MGEGGVGLSSFEEERERDFWWTAYPGEGKGRRQKEENVLRDGGPPQEQHAGAIKLDRLGIPNSYQASASVLNAGWVDGYHPIRDGRWSEAGLWRRSVSADAFICAEMRRSQTAATVASELSNRL